MKRRTAPLADYHHLLHLAVLGAAMLMLPILFGDILYADSSFPDRLFGCSAALITWTVLRATTPIAGRLSQGLIRLAATLCLWNLGFLLLPDGGNLWMGGISFSILAIPAGLFLLRSELRPQAPDEKADRVAAGLLFLFILILVALFAAVVILFKFEHDSLLLEAMLVIGCGLGLLRLSRQIDRVGVSLLCMALISSGAVWLTTMFSDGPITAPWKAFSVVAILHTIAAPLLWPAELPYRFRFFTGLEDAAARRFRWGFYLMTNLSLQGFSLLLLLKGGGSPVNALTFLAAAAGWLHAYRGQATPVAALQVGLILFPASSWSFAAVPDLALSAGWLILLASCIVARRRNGGKSRNGLTNPVISVLFTLALAHIISTSFPSTNALGQGLLLGGLWLCLPNRPFADAPAPYALQSWIPVSWFIVACWFGGFTGAHFLAWSVLLAFPVAALPILVGTRLAPTRDAVVQAGLGWIPAALIMAAAAFITAPTRFASGFGAFGLLLAVLMTAAIFFLNHAGREREFGRRVFVWATEIGMWLVVGLVRWRLNVQQVLQLGTPIDAYLLLGVGAVAAGIREVLQRRRHDLQKTFQRAAHFYALLGWIAMMWLSYSNDAWHHGSLFSLLLAGLYFAFSRTQHRRFILAAAGFANLSLGLWMADQGMNHVLFYLVPVAFTVTALTQILRDELDENQIKLIRLTTSLILLGTSAFFNLIDFRDSLWFPVGAALLSALGVVVGISLRIRIYLYLGVGFFLANVTTTLVHMVMLQPPDAVKLAVGMVFLVLGCLFTGSFLIFQMKRRELLRRYQALRLELAGWE